MPLHAGLSSKQRFNFGSGFVEFGRRHPVLAVFVVALAARVLVACVVSAVVPTSPIQDDAGYTSMAQVFASGRLEQWDPVTPRVFWSNATFLVPLTTLYLWFGPIQLLGQWMVALVGALVAAVTAAVGVRVMGRRPGLVAGLVVALLPSQVFFSSLTLKDAFVWICLALLAWSLAQAAREKSAACLIWSAAVAGASSLALTRLRPHTTIVACLALLLASPFTPDRSRRWVVVGSIGLLIAVPWLGGFGPAGTGYLRELDSVSDYREAQAVGATAIFDKPEAHASDSDASTAALELTAPSEPAKPADPRRSTDAEMSDVPETARNLRHLPRGITVMLFEPFPWRMAHNVQLMLAKLEMLIWYPLVVLALYGLFKLLGSGSALERAGLAFPVFAWAGTMLVAALGEGNFGTAYRHRGEFVWSLVLLAAYGMHRKLGARPAVADQIRISLS